MKAWLLDLARDPYTGRVRLRDAIWLAVVGCCTLAIALCIAVLVWSFFAPPKADTGTIAQMRSGLRCVKVCTPYHEIELQDGRWFDVDGEAFGLLGAGEKVRVTYQGVLTNGVEKVAG